MLIAQQNEIRLGPERSTRYEDAKLSRKSFKSKKYKIVNHRHTMSSFRLVFKIQNSERGERINGIAPKEIEQNQYQELMTITCKLFCLMYFQILITMLDRGNSVSPVSRNFTKAFESWIGARITELCRFSFLFSSSESIMRESRFK